VRNLFYLVTVFISFFAAAEKKAQSLAVNPGFTRFGSAASSKEKKKKKKEKKKTKKKRKRKKKTKKKKKKWNNGGEIKRKRSRSEHKPLGLRAWGCGCGGTKENEINTPRRSNALLTCRLAVF
jgi:Ni/Co efflux regulator RcnB